MSDFAIEKRAGIDVMVFADESCQPASRQESWLYAENKRLRAERNVLQKRLADREDLLRHIRSKRTVHPCPGCCDTDRLIDTAMRGERDE